MQVSITLDLVCLEVVQLCPQWLRLPATPEWPELTLAIPCPIWILFCQEIVRDSVLSRGRPKVEIPLLAVTESKPKVTYYIWLKPYVPPKVKRDFRPKTETESQSHLSLHD